jgi:uncharacterized protein (TIGR03067 family)
MTNLALLLAVFGGFGAAASPAIPTVTTAPGGKVRLTDVHPAGGSLSGVHDTVGPCEPVLVKAVGDPPAAAGAKPDDAATRRERERLQGRWRLVEVKTNLAPDQVAERKDGKWVSGPGLEAAHVRRIRGVTFVIEGDWLRVERAPGAASAWDYGLGDCTLRLDPSTSPRGLDLTLVSRAIPKTERRAFGACYLLDGDDLWLCDRGGNTDRPKDFSMAVGIGYPKRIFVLKREPGRQRGK